jgi:hypothetical protein
MDNKKEVISKVIPLYEKAILPWLPVSNKLKNEMLSTKVKFWKGTSILLALTLIAGWYFDFLIVALVLNTPWYLAWYHYLNK